MNPYHEELLAAGFECTLLADYRRGALWVESDRGRWCARTPHKYTAGHPSPHHAIDWLRDEAHGRLREARAAVERCERELADIGPRLTVAMLEAAP